jgi:hypothetical protein
VLKKKDSLSVERVTRSWNVWGEGRVPQISLIEILSSFPEGNEILLRKQYFNRELCQDAFHKGGISHCSEEQIWKKDPDPGCFPSPVLMTTCRGQ